MHVPIDSWNDYHSLAGGPYIISCDDNRLFLTVDTSNHTVLATHEIGNASLFFIDPNEDTGNINEFTITYYGDSEAAALTLPSSRLTPTSEEVQRPLGRYLSAPHNIAGFHSGPLQLQFTAMESDSRFKLLSRLVKHHSPVDISEWVHGREAFYISCHHKTFKKDGYVCIRRRRNEFVTACVPRRTFHNEVDTWMLFRILPHTFRNRATISPPIPGPAASPTSSIDPLMHSELVDYEAILDENTFPLVPLHASSSNSGVRFSIEGTSV